MTAGFFPAEPVMRRSIQRWRGRPVYVLVERMLYVSRDGYEHVLEVGVTTDWASVPRWATWLCPVDDKAGFAAMLHDDLLARGQVSRREADWRFYVALGELGVPRWRAWVMWQAVALRTRNLGL